MKDRISVQMAKSWALFLPLSLIKLIKEVPGQLLARKVWVRREGHFHIHQQEAPVITHENGKKDQKNAEDKRIQDGSKLQLHHRRPECDCMS